VKRWPVVLLVLLALVVLISPGIIGRLAEKNLEENFDWAESESGGIEFQTESFDRGWFSSEGRHRVVLSGAAFRGAAAAYRAESGYPDLPSLVIDTRLDHGLLPITSLGRESGSLAPGLASTVSTFQIDPGNGELVPLPGSLYSAVSLSGASDSRYLLEAGTFENDEVRVTWQGADIAIQTDWSTGKVVMDGRIEPLSVTDDSDTLRVGPMSISANQVRSDYGFSVGTAEFRLESLQVESQDAPLTVGNVSISGNANIDASRLNIGSKISVDEVAVPGLGDVNFAMDLSLNRLDAASTAVIAQAFKEAQSSPDPEMALAEMFPRIEGDLQRIVSSGAEIRIDQLDVTLPQGKVSTKLNIEVPEGDAAADFSWAGVLLAMTASADIRMPAELFEYISMMNPQAGSLVAMGILISDGDDVVMNAEYAQGLLTVNGAPMPIPMPGM
jgi:uncharacterized protein YdgA (DUF945 family)